MTEEEVIDRIVVLQGKTDESSIKCVFCKNVIVFVEHHKALRPGHVYSSLGLSEVNISRACEYCFDEVTKEPEESEVCTCDNPCCEADVGVGIITCGSQHCRIHGGAGGVG